MDFVEVIEQARALLQIQLREAGTIVGLTPAGGATARLYDFNDPERVHERIHLEATRKRLH